MLSSEGPGPRLQIDSDASEDSDVDMGVSEDEQPAVVDYERLRAERIASNLQRMGEPTPTDSRASHIYVIVTALSCDTFL